MYDTKQQTILPTIASRLREGLHRSGVPRLTRVPCLSRARCDAGQATAEYALVMLAAAGLAGSVLAWAVGTDAVSRMMDAVVEQLIGQVS